MVNSPPPSSPVVQRQLQKRKNRSIVTMLKQQRSKPYEKKIANAVGQGGLPLLSAQPVQKDYLGQFSDDVFNHSSSLDISLQNSYPQADYSLADIEHLLQHDDSDDASEPSPAVTPKDVDSLFDKSTPPLDDIFNMSAEDLFQTHCT